MAAASENPLDETGTTGKSIVVADDDEGHRRLLGWLLGRAGYRVRCAADGQTALDLIREEAPDLVVSDVVMPKIDGFELCRRVKNGEQTRLTPVVLLTGLRHVDDRVRGIEAGADEVLIKPVEPRVLRARVQALLRQKRYTDDLDSAAAIFLSLGLAVEARDRCTAGHCHRMATAAAAFGSYLELPDDQVGALYRAGYLHDVGKIVVPDSILSKPGPLDAAEFELMKQHTVVGDTLCKNLKSLKLVHPIVRHHHERLDGSGYPDRLKGDAIPLLAQIIAIVDVYDALTSDRPYRRALSPSAACEILREESRKGWHDAQLVEKFLSHLVRGEAPAPNGEDSRNAAGLPLPDGRADEMPRSWGGR